MPTHIDTTPAPKTTETHPQNRVLQADLQRSQNFYVSDRVLQHFLSKSISQEGLGYVQPLLQHLGAEVADRLTQLSMLADKHTPVLRKRNWLGETVNEIDFHPAYWALVKAAVDSQMLRVKWEPSLRQRFAHESHRLGFAINFVYGLAENGVGCPLCMTDGVARLIDRYCDEADRARLLPRIYTERAEDFYTGAMFLTEKAGGSDVGANLVSAMPTGEGDYYYLNGEKWFCSNANAQIIFALARVNPNIRGTAGLSIFLVEPHKPDGSKNPLEIVRLKDKLGVRSMASAECLLTDTIGKRVDAEGEGFKIMADMVNLSRLYNAVGSVAQSRRGLIEAYHFLLNRVTFGKSALAHALVREKLTELGAKYIANFYLVWDAITLLDMADNGNEEAAHLLRLVTPMAKKYTAEAGVYIIRECMELMGGLGYIEDGVMPKLFRDMLVLPIWEGAGNIMTLDMLRASLKSKGLWLMLSEIEKSLPAAGAHREVLAAELARVRDWVEELGKHDQETTEITAKYLFDTLVQLYQISLLVRYRDEESAIWIDPAIAHLLQGAAHTPRKPASVETIQNLLGWLV